MHIAKKLRNVFVKCLHYNNDNTNSYVNNASRQVKKTTPLLTDFFVRRFTVPDKVTGRTGRSNHCRRRRIISVPRTARTWHTRRGDNLPVPSVRRSSTDGRLTTL